MKAKFLGALLTGVAMLIALPAWATSITFDLSSCAEAGLGASVCPNKDAGTNTITYHSGGQWFTALGNSITASTNHLFVKQGGGGEAGLGMAADTADGEIQSTDFVTLDLSSLFTAGFNSATIFVESIQGGEGADVCQGDSTDALGTTNCMDLDNPSGGVTQWVTLSLTGSTDVVSITADAGNVLASSVIATSPVPEPGSLLLLGSGLLGLGVVVRRRLKP